MNELALFSGAGGGILGGHLLGWKTVCAVEFAPYPKEVLIQRQREGIIPPFPVWDDVKTFDGRPWRGCVDIVSGGFPCTDISAAGKGAGITGTESGIWKEMSRICGDVRPRYVWIENSPLLTIRGLDVVLWDLAAMGFDAEWGVVSSADAGGSSLRERIWILGYTPGARFSQGEPGSLRAVRDGSWRTESERRSGDVADAMHSGSSPERRESWEQGGPWEFGEDVADAYRKPGTAESITGIGQRPVDACRNGEEGRDDEMGHGSILGRERPRTSRAGRTGLEDARDGTGTTAQPRLGGNADGLARGMDLLASGHRLPVAGRGPEQFPWEPPRTCKGFKGRADRIRAIGNGQDPWALALAWEILSSRIS